MGTYSINRHLVPVVGILLIISAISSALRLSPQGGYDLVVSVEHQDLPTEPIDQLKYIQNLKLSMEVFSTQLSRATKGQFHVSSVELIIPSTWTSFEAVDFAEVGGVQTADIRISDAVQYPHAKNPNLCFLPGEYMELPFNFFSNANSNEFGPIYKTLLVLFARYRFGAWEEHGFVGDEKFPYFVKNSVSASWEVTGCNNAPLVGKFVNLEDKEECEIDWSANETTFSSCRFVPDRISNTASTSLMHFHWMDSVQNFCDEEDHNKFAMNKHNVFCDHKSVMQVIRESSDYAVVTNPRNDSIPAVTFKMVKQSAKPLLYVLLDRGLIQGPHVLANLLPLAVATLIGHPSLEDVIAAVGSYPSDVAGSFVKQEVEWSQLGKSLDTFITAIGELRTDGPLERDFSRAIMEVTEKIKKRGHPHGAVILSIKYGADMDNLNKSLPESNLIVALNQQKIILHSMELGVTTNPKSHLSQVASASNGGYTTLESIGGSQQAIWNVLSLVNKTLNDPTFISSQATFRTISKIEVSSTASEIIVPIPPAARQLDIYYSSLQRLVRGNFIMQIDGANTTLGSFRRSIDFNADEGSGLYTYLIRFSSALIDGKRRISVRHNCEEECSGTMTGRVDIDETNPAAQFVDIELSVSSNIVDLSQHVPLTLNAKITLDGIAIENLFGEATITTSTTSHIITLLDDGNLPDALENDGIYSAYYAPELDGEYQVAVRFYKTTPLRKLEKESRLSESSLSRLLPIDQGPGAGCEVFNNCTLETIYDDFMQTEQLPFSITFTNAVEFQAKPAKVFLIYLPLLSLLSWVSPRVPGFHTGTTVTGYEVRKSSSREQLRDNFENCEIAVNVTNLVGPGVPQLVSVPRPTTTTYFAVVAVYNMARSDISNIQVGLEDPDQITDPTGPTTTVDPTAPTTTADPTAPTTTVDPTAPTTTTDPTAPTTTVDPTAPTTTVDPTAPTTTVDPTASTTTTTAPTGTAPTVTDPTGTTTPPPNFGSIQKPIFFTFFIATLISLYVSNSN